MNNHLVDVSPCYSCSVRSCNNLHRAAASHFLVRSTVKGEFWRDLPKPGLNDFFLHSRSWNKIFVHLRCWSTLLFSLHPIRYVKNKKKCPVQYTYHAFMISACKASWPPALLQLQKVCPFISLLFTKLIPNKTTEIVRLAPRTRSYCTVCARLVHPREWPGFERVKRIGNSYCSKGNWSRPRSKFVGGFRPLF